MLMQHQSYSLCFFFLKCLELLNHRLFFQINIISRPTYTRYYKEESLRGGSKILVEISNLGLHGSHECLGTTESTLCGSFIVILFYKSIITKLIVSLVFSWDLF